MTFNFDNSLLETWAECEAESVASAVLGRQGKKRALYGDLGNVMHAALDCHFNDGSKDEVVQAFSDAYDKVIPVGESPDDEAMTKDNLLTILDQYIKTRPVKAYPFEVLETEKVVGVEVKEGFKFWMKRDLLAKDKQTGAIYPVDHKTRWGQINEWWTKKFRLSSQFSGYIWGTEQTTGKKCDRVYVNAISCGKLPNSTRKCKLHKMPYNECRAQHADFQLLLYSRTPEQIEKWRLDMLFFAEQAEKYFQVFDSVDMLKYALRRGTYNGGCVFCEFAEWCRGGFQADEMDQLTVYRPWEPWKGVEDGKAAKGEKYPYFWLWDKTLDSIYTSEKAVSGVTVLPRDMALKKLWDRGKDNWMHVWKNFPEAQKEMAEFGRSKLAGNTTES